MAELSFSFATLWSSRTGCSHRADVGRLSTPATYLITEVVPHPHEGQWFFFLIVGKHAFNYFVTTQDVLGKNG